MNKKFSRQLLRQEGAASSHFTSWYHRELELLKKADSMLINVVKKDILGLKNKRSCLAKKAKQDLTLPETPLKQTCDLEIRSQSQKSSRTRLYVATNDRKSSFPYLVVFVYDAKANKAKNAKLMEEDYSWLEVAGRIVYLSPPRAQSACPAEDEEFLRLQTQVILHSFLRSHCYDVPRRVHTPVWLLTRLFQGYCLAASVPEAELVDSVVGECVEKHFVETFQFRMMEGMASVYGVCIYTDSPLHTLWASKAVIVENRKQTNDALIKGTKSAFTKCVLVHPFEAMSGIRFFDTDAEEKATTAKYIAKAVARKLQQEYACDFRELNRMEFGHLMCKGNRGIKTVRPQSRIMPPNRKDKQEYQYARVSPRPTPLLTRDDLAGVIQQRGFTLPRDQKLHLMRNALLHSNYCSGKDSDASY